MNVNPVSVEPVLARKRLRNEDQWRRNREKRMRYSATGPPIFPQCNHKSAKMQCSKLHKNDVDKFHFNFYSHRTKVEQDCFILKYVSAKTPARHRSNETREPRCLTLDYFIPSSNGNNKVCQKCFLGILKVGKDRVQGIMKRHNFLGRMPCETRGGDRQSLKNHERLSAVMEFIQQFKCCESHYCRSKTTVRKYLPSELSIRKMWLMYEEQCLEKFHVKQSYFRNIFNTKYNLGFGTPRTDRCSTCIQYEEELKVVTDPEKNKDIETLKNLHLLKAKAFYKKLKQIRPGLLTISFDCQKNQMLPRMPDQAAYYSRKIACYNLTIVQGNSKASLTTSNTFIYVWNETLLPKGANEISSAVFHRLQHIDMSGIDTLRLVADGCGGQNKNSILFTMLCYWFEKFAPDNLKHIEVVFPMVGHSFLPPDRVFGLVERALKPFEVIVSPEEYINVYKTFGTVNFLGSDSCPDYDWKFEAKHFLRPPQNWHFKFAPTKRFFLKKNTSGRVVIKGEANYNIDTAIYKSVIKRKILIKTMQPNVITPGNTISEAKAKDVLNLLVKHYGENWKSHDLLKFYLDIKISNNQTNAEEIECQENVCEEDVENV